MATTKRAMPKCSCHKVMYGISVRTAYLSSVIMIMSSEIVGRPGFDSLVESDQTTLKVGVHSFPA